MDGAQKYPTHCAVYRARARQIQGLLAELVETADANQERQPVESKTKPTSGQSGGGTYVKSTGTRFSRPFCVCGLGLHLFEHHPVYHVVSQLTDRGDSPASKRRSKARQCARNLRLVGTLSLAGVKYGIATALDRSAFAI